MNSLRKVVMSEGRIVQDPFDPDGPLGHEPTELFMFFLDYPGLETEIRPFCLSIEGLAVVKTGQLVETVIKHATVEHGKAVYIFCEQLAVADRLLQKMMTLVQRQEDEFVARIASVLPDDIDKYRLRPSVVLTEFDLIFIKNETILISYHLEHAEEDGTSK